MMNRQTLRALVALNVVLLVAVGVLGLMPTNHAEAQLGRSPEFLMIAGNTSGRQEQSIYIVETSSARMVAVIYRSGDKTLEVIGGRELSADLRAQPTVGR